MWTDNNDVQMDARAWVYYKLTTCEHNSSSELKTICFGTDKPDQTVHTQISNQTAPEGAVCLGSTLFDIQYPQFSRISAVTSNHSNFRTITIC